MLRIKTASESEIKGVFLDYGGVIEDLAPDEGSLRRGFAEIRRLLGEKGIDIGGERIGRMIRGGQEEYERWYAGNGFQELPGARIWSSFLLKEVCADSSRRSVVEGMGEELGSVYEFYLFKRRVARDLKLVVMSLFYSGYVLALVSNTISLTLIPERLKKFGIDKYFRAVVLSVACGFRKPSPNIFREALERTGLSPDRCMFVGDTLSRDIEGSRGAGFRTSVLLTSGLTGEKDEGCRGRDPAGSLEPDQRISALSDLERILGR
jgi:putative hydrolase of the HAD superfamily